MQVRVFCLVEWNWSLPGTGMGKQSAMVGSRQQPGTSDSGVRLYTQQSVVKRLWHKDFTWTFYHKTIP